MQALKLKQYAQTPNLRNFIELLFWYATEILYPLFQENLNSEESGFIKKTVPFSTIKCSITSFFM